MNAGSDLPKEIGSVASAGWVRTSIKPSFLSMARALLVCVALGACLPLLLHATPSAAARTAGSTVAQESVHTSGREWTDLTAQQREVLGPLHDQWSQLSVPQQQRLQRIAQRWQDASPPRRAAIEQHLSRWAAMTLAQRAALASRYEAFHQLPPDEQQNLRAAYQRYSALPADQRRQLRERFAAMTASERAAFAAGAAATEHNRGWQRFMADVPPAERAATRSMWLALAPEQRHALRRHWRTLSQVQRSDLRTRLLAMAPEARNALISTLQSTESGRSDPAH